jgi:hypothetical protein
MARMSSAIQRPTTVVSAIHSLATVTTIATSEHHDHPRKQGQNMSSLSLKPANRSGITGAYMG